jgi:tRNA(His) 5'-end guanylyltransferase
MRDELGDRMKKNYENRTRILLPRRTYTIIRVDGKAFHTYTRGCQRPFDEGLIADMNETACYLCKNIQGAKIGFVQSDEISILMTDFDTLTTDAWFDGNIQKIVSVAASMATSKFNQLRLKRLAEEYNQGDNSARISFEFLDKMKLAEFDARTFTIPMKTEVMNYFIWRQQDTVRNSISSVAQSLYSTEELKNKNMSVQQEMIWQKGINWNDYDSTLKRGRFVFKEQYEVEADPELKRPAHVRSRWVARACPTFTQEPDFLELYVPDNCNI